MPNLSLADRLKVESSRRIQGGIWFQILLLLFLAYTFGPEPNQTALFPTLVFMNLILVLTRGLIFRLHSKDLTSLVRLYHYVMLTTTLTAFIYGCIIYDAIMHYKTLNAQVIILIFVINGLMTAVLSH